MRCYDWATEISRQDVVVVSGFSSQLEKDVLYFLLKGVCHIKLVLARAPYKNIPKEYLEYVADGRMEIVSASDWPRQTKDSARQRNQLIASEADEIVFASLQKDSSLYDIYTRFSDKAILL